MSEICITFDVDWAPDWAIEDCAEACVNRGVPATFFATHESSVLKELSKDDRFEIGVHPNFLPMSSQGKDERSVMETLLNWYPKAASMRTHALVQSTALWQMIAREFPQIRLDVSLFLPFHPVQGRFHYPIVEETEFHRLAYNWEDDVAAYDSGWTWPELLPTNGGLQVLDFHPVFVAMNLDRIIRYQRFKDRYAGQFLSVTRDQMSEFDHSGRGARSYFSFALGRDAVYFKASNTPKIAGQE